MKQQMLYHPTSSNCPISKIFSPKNLDTARCSTNALAQHPLQGVLVNAFNLSPPSFCSANKCKSFSTQFHCSQLFVYLALLVVALCLTNCCNVDGDDVELCQYFAYSFNQHRIALARAIAIIIMQHFSCRRV